MGPYRSPGRTVLRGNFAEASAAGATGTGKSPGAEPAATRACCLGERKHTGARTTRPPLRKQRPSTDSGGNPNGELPQSFPKRKETVFGDGCGVLPGAGVREALGAVPPKPRSSGATAGAGGAELGQISFPPPGGRSHEAQQSGSPPCKTKFFAFWDRTKTGQCPAESQSRRLDT